MRRGDGAQGRNRTTDTAIFSRMLYQLSYLGAGAQERRGRRFIGRRLDVVQPVLLRSVRRTKLARDGKSAPARDLP